MSDNLKMYIFKTIKREKTMEEREINENKPIKGGNFFQIYEENKNVV